MQLHPGVGCSIRLARSFFSAAVKALDRRASEMMTQRMLDPTDETNSAMPCPNRLVDMATIARMKVATKKMNPKPKIQNVRNPRIRHIQPALTRMTSRQRVSQLGASLDRVEMTGSLLRYARH